jgi:hypothetical protein
MQAEQRATMVTGTFRLGYPSQRNEPSQPPGTHALNNSPTSARQTSSNCTASARRRLSNFAAPSPHAACHSPEGAESIRARPPSYA